MERKEPLDLYGREWEATGMIPRGGGDKASLAGTLARAVKPQPPGPNPELDAIIKAGELAAAMPKAAPDRFTQTGWTFKDYLPPYRYMDKNDWRRVEQTDSMSVELPIRSLYASQKTVNPDYATVPSQPVYGASNPNATPFVIKKAGKYFVADGHHRLTAAAQQGRQTARVRLVDLDNTTQTSFPLLDWMGRP